MAATPGLQHPAGRRQARRLTIHNAACGSYALKVMTIVVVIFFPLVLPYQGWTCYVFRQRLSPGDSRLPALLARQGSLAGQPDGRAGTGRARHRPGRAGGRARVAPDLHPRQAMPAGAACAASRPKDHEEPRWQQQQTRWTPW